MIIGIDFDGTLVTHKFPDIGDEVSCAVSVCHRLHSRGHRLILWTMRDSHHLRAAVEWCNERNISLWGINKNPGQTWTTSPKAYCQFYIDDAALGCPLIRPRDGRPYVDWLAIEKLLIVEGIL